MGFFKKLGIFTMLTAKDKSDFGLGAMAYLADSLKEEAKKEQKEAMEEFWYRRNLIMDEWIEFIETLDISKYRQEKAIGLCNELRKTMDDRKTDKIIKQINEVTGYNFESE